MKAVVLVTALVTLAAAQPHRGHQHAHAKVEKKRDVVITEVAYVTEVAQAPGVVIVDQFGNVIGTSYDAAPAPTPQAQPDPIVVPQEWVPESTPDTPAPAPTPDPTPEPAPSQAPVNNGGNNNNDDTSSDPPAPPPAPASGKGICYSPYTSSGGCKNYDQVKADFDRINGYGKARIYGVDCNQLNTVGPVVKAKGMKLFAGVYNIGNVQGETQAIIDAFKNDWSFIDTVSVGNELVNSRQSDPASVVAAVNTARGMLRGAGYNGPVVTVDTFLALIAHPELCHASDYAAANAHAFFNPTIAAAGAGAWAKLEQAAVSAACGKKTIITESGYPSAGNCNGAACPSPQNQQAALASLNSAFGSGDDLFLFSAFNDPWKALTADTFFAEQSWGIYGNSAS